MRLLTAMILSAILFIHLQGQATPAVGDLPQTFSFDGVLQDTAGNPLTTNATLVFGIYDPGKTCLLYEETQTVVPNPATGAFNVKIGTPVGSALRTANDSGNSWVKVFQNSVQIMANAVNCVAGSYSPVAGEARSLRVTVNGNVLAPDFAMTSVPTATVADSLRGKLPADFLAVRDDAVAVLNQGNLENIFSFTNYPKLNALLTGSSSQYQASNPTSAVIFNGQLASGLANPVAAQDAATKSYADGTIGGKTAVLSGIGPGVGNGLTMVWDSAANNWVAGSPTDTSKLPLTGGNLSGNLNISTSLNVSNKITTGQIGIGTSFPSFPLDIYSGGSTATIGLRVPTAYFSLNVSGSYFVLRDEMMAATRLSIDNQGNTGIGTSTPAAKLDVYGHLGSSGPLTVTPGTCSAGVPAVAANSTDLRGSVTTSSSSPTVCTLNFGTTYSPAPTCVVSWANPTASTTGITATTSTTQLTVKFSTAANSMVFNYICLQ